MTAAWTFDGDGHCSSCHLSESSINRIERLITAAKAFSVRAHVVCGHTQVYCSLGLWTSALRSVTQSAAAVASEQLFRASAHP